MTLELEIDEHEEIPEEEIQLAGAPDSPLAEAARFLDQALHAGCNEPQVAYLLALAHKRLGRPAEARAALRKIPRPDANVLVQMGLLSLRENQPAQAEQEFARAWQMDAASFAACHNLLLSRLTLGKVKDCLAMLPKAIQLCPSREQKHLFSLLHELLRNYQEHSPAAGDMRPLLMLDPDSPLENLGDGDEQKLIALFRSLGQIDVTFNLLRTLAGGRPNSAAVGAAYLEAAIIKARDLMNRCLWTEARWLLGPLTLERGAPRPQLAALHNLLGCCCYLTQDFEKAATHFAQAVKFYGNDPRLQQNLALAYERSDEPDDAEQRWVRLLEGLGGGALSVPPDVPHYLQALEFETLLHVANLFAGKERWSQVMSYLQRAHKMRPDDTEVLERMFHVYAHMKQPHSARKVLDKLRVMRPNDPQLDLYEIDLVEVKNLSDIERMLTEIERVLRRHPDDHRVEEKAVNMVGNVVPLMGQLCDQLTEQLNKVLGQVENLPRYQVDWSALREIMRDLVKEFQKLRRITGKCLPLVSNDEHKRIVRDLASHIDKKIEACRSMGA